MKQSGWGKFLLNRRHGKKLKSSGMTNMCLRRAFPGCASWECWLTSSFCLCKDRSNYPACARRSLKGFVIWLLHSLDKWCCWNFLAEKRWRDENDALLKRTFDKAWRSQLERMECLILFTKTSKTSLERYSALDARGGSWEGRKTRRLFSKTGGNLWMVPWFWLQKVWGYKMLMGELNCGILL